jgi:hypothetical protein
MEDTVYLILYPDDYFMGKYFRKRTMSSNTAVAYTTFEAAERAIRHAPGVSRKKPRIVQFTAVRTLTKEGETWQ